MQGSGNPAEIELERTFAEWVTFHMDRGTRPDGHPDLEGSRWSTKEFAGKLGVDGRTIRNWRSGRTVPPILQPIEKAFFGANVQYSNWLDYLRKAYRMDRSTTIGNIEKIRNSYNDMGIGLINRKSVLKFIENKVNIPKRSVEYLLGRKFIVEPVHQKRFYRISELEVKYINDGLPLMAYRRVVDERGLDRASSGILMRSINHLYFIMDIDGHEGIEVINFREGILSAASSLHGYILGVTENRNTYIEKCLLFNEKIMPPEIQSACIIAGNEFDEIFKSSGNNVD